MWRIFGHLGYDEWMRDKARVVMTRREAAGIRNPVAGVRKSSQAKITAYPSAVRIILLLFFLSSKLVNF